MAPTTEVWCSTKLAWLRWAQLKRYNASASDVDDDDEEEEEDWSFEEEEEEEDAFSAAAICSGEAYACGVWMPEAMR